MSEQNEKQKIRTLLAAIDSVVTIAEGLDQEIVDTVHASFESVSPIVNRRLMQLEERGLQKGIEADVKLGEL